MSAPAFGEKLGRRVNSQIGKAQSLDHIFAVVPTPHSWGVRLAAHRVGFEAVYSCLPIALLHTRIHGNTGQSPRSNSREIASWVYYLLPGGRTLDHEWSTESGKLRVSTRGASRSIRTRTAVELRLSKRHEAEFRYVRLAERDESRFLRYVPPASRPKAKAQLARSRRHCGSANPF
jgi:hypothetical protein